MTRQESEVIFSTIFLPTITHPFPATKLSPQILEEVQSMTTAVILSNIGYDQHMSKVVVYAPKSGPLLRHLHTEQGHQQIKHLLKHLRAQTTPGEPFATMIQVYQIFSRNHQSSVGGNPNLL